MSAFNLLHLVTKSQPVSLRACGLPSGSRRDKKNYKVVFTQEELRKRLTPLQYHVTQEKGTERMNHQHSRFGSHSLTLTTINAKGLNNPVPLLESTHTIKQMEYTNVLYAEPLFSSLKKNLIPTQVGPPSMMQSVPMQYRLLTTILMECTG
ncbi:methionine-R-sulfoxide reductase B3 isoform X6 [Bombina bombina]|uniref:methionine-R-sulfoxide reductase B3 isoform X6 n=1 Tax=Bombina bombina TaxID=8345 RepID=UPI00235A4A95|nr:methionine-R-sulfoxide reductase B3 isoform X6 [Bombina bombina]